MEWALREVEETSWKSGKEREGKMRGTASQKRRDDEMKRGRKCAIPRAIPRQEDARGDTIPDESLTAR